MDQYLTFLNRKIQVIKNQDWPVPIFFFISQRNTSAFLTQKLCGLNNRELFHSNCFIINHSKVSFVFALLFCFLWSCIFVYASMSLYICFVVHMEERFVPLQQHNYSVSFRKVRERFYKISAQKSQKLNDKHEQTEIG